MGQNGGFHNLLVFLLPEKFHADRPYLVNSMIFPKIDL